MNDLHERGAEEPERLHLHHGQATLQTLFQEKWLALVPTPLGELVVLGSAGRRALNLSPFYLSPPEAAATQLIRRRIRDALELRGWQYQGRPSRNLMLFVTEQGQRVYVLARYGDYHPRSVCRVLATVRADLMREGGILLLWTQHPQRFRAVARRANELLVLHPYGWPLGGGS